MRRAIIVLPAPGGPISSVLWPPAAAISSARRASACPCTSAKSPSAALDRRAPHAAAGASDGTERGRIVQRADRFGERPHRRELEALTTDASAAFGGGSNSPAKRSRRAAAAIGRTPRAAWIAAVERQLAEQEHIMDVARVHHARRRRTPSAIGRSNDDPAFRTSAGAGSR